MGTLVALELEGTRRAGSSTVSPRAAAKSARCGPRRTGRSDTRERSRQAATVMIRETSGPRASTRCEVIEIELGRGHERDGIARRARRVFGTRWRALHRGRRIATEVHAVGGANPDASALGHARPFGQRMFQLERQAPLRRCEQAIRRDLRTRVRVLNIRLVRCRDVAEHRVELLPVVAPVLRGRRGRNHERHSSRHQDRRVDVGPGSANGVGSRQVFPVSAPPTNAPPATHRVTRAMYTPVREGRRLPNRPIVVETLERAVSLQISRQPTLGCELDEIDLGAPVLSDGP